MSSLTPRQMEVLRLLADGRSDADIACLLGVTVATARTHVRQVRQALKVPSRGQAVAKAYAEGLLARPIHKFRY